MGAVFAAFFLWNIFVGGVYAFDKLAARRDWRRVPERTLIILALAFAGPGAYAAMQLVRHKTQHKMFALGVPVIALAQVALIISFLFSSGGIV